MNAKAHTHVTAYDVSDANPAFVLRRMEAIAEEMRTSVDQLGVKTDANMATIVAALNEIKSIAVDVRALARRVDILEKRVDDLERRPRTYTKRKVRKS